MKISLRPLKRVLKTAMSRYRYKDALRIEATLHNRLQELLAKHHPDIKVKLHRWQWTLLHDVRWGGSFSVLVYLDGTCFCGMSFDLIGRYLIISQIHGVGLNRCRYRPMRRFWEITLVRAAHDLGFRTLLIRADHANSWPHATTEIRQRLARRLDATAHALGMTTKGAYWVWKEDLDQESHSRQDGFRPGPIGGFSLADALIVFAHWNVSWVTIGGKRVPDQLLRRRLEPAAGPPTHTNNPRTQTLWRACKFLTRSHNANEGVALLQDTKK